MKSHLQSPYMVPGTEEVFSNNYQYNAHCFIYFMQMGVRLNSEAQFEPLLLNFNKIRTLFFKLMLLM